MPKLLATVAVVSLALLGGAASARSEPGAYSGHLGLSIVGWGTVDLKAGLVEHGRMTCSGVFCTTKDNPYRLHRSPVVLVEKPLKGWKFAGWRGACHGRKPKCVINLARLHPNAGGSRNLHVGARYHPVGAGFTRGHPIPLGTTAKLGPSVRLRVDSVRQNVDLSPAPPPGAEYFAANLTLSYGNGNAPYTTAGSSLGGLPVVGSHNTRYTGGTGACPSVPQPQLNLDSPLYRGQSETGYVCWTINTNDASSLEYYYGTGGPHPGRTIWFALH